MYICSFTQISTYMHTCIYIYLSLYRHPRTYVSTYACVNMYICIHLLVFVYISVYLYNCIYIYINSYIIIYICVHTYMCIYTYLRTYIKYIYIYIQTALLSGPPAAMSRAAPWASRARMLAKLRPYAAPGSEQARRAFKRPKALDPIVPILSSLGDWAILLGTFGDPGRI